MLKKAEGIVLRTIPFRETSKIATFYTKDFGKLKVLFKGIRTDTKKFASTLEPFSLNELIFYFNRNKDLHLAGQCDLKESFDIARFNLKSSSIASYLLELTDSLTAVEDNHPEVFNLLLDSLEKLNQNLDPFKVLVIFQIKILHLVGFKPHLDSCVICNSLIDKKAHFSNRLGGLICLNCMNKDEYAYAIFPGTVASILHIERSNWQKNNQLMFGSKIESELKKILNNFLIFHLEKRLKSTQLLDILADIKGGL